MAVIPVTQSLLLLHVRQDEEHAKKACSALSADKHQDLRRMCHSSFGSTQIITLPSIRMRTLPSAMQRTAY